MPRPGGGGLRGRVRGRRPAGGGQARRARPHPAPGHRGTTLAEALAGAPWAAATRRAPGSCTASTATRRGCSRGQVRGRLRGAARHDRRPRGGAALPGAGGRPSRRGERHHRRPLGRDRDHRSLQSTRTDSGREAVTHFDGPRAAAAHRAAGRAARDGAHPSDQGAPRRDRPSRLRGPPLRGRGCGSRLGLTRQFLHARN